MVVAGERGRIVAGFGDDHIRGQRHGGRHGAAGAVHGGRVEVHGQLRRAGLGHPIGCRVGERKRRGGPGIGAGDGFDAEGRPAPEAHPADVAAADVRIARDGRDDGADRGIERAVAIVREAGELVDAIAADHHRVAIGQAAGGERRDREVRLLDDERLGPGAAGEDAADGRLVHREEVGTIWPGEVHALPDFLGLNVFRANHQAALLAEECLRQIAGRVRGCAVILRPLVIHPTHGGRRQRCRSGLAPALAFPEPTLLAVIVDAPHRLGVEPVVGVAAGLVVRDDGAFPDRRVQDVAAAGDGHVGKSAGRILPEIIVWVHPAALRPGQVLILRLGVIVHRRRPGDVGLLRADLVIANQRTIRELLVGPERIHPVITHVPRGDGGVEIGVALPGGVGIGERELDLRLDGIDHVHRAVFRLAVHRLNERQLRVVEAATLLHPDVPGVAAAGCPEDGVDGAGEGAGRIAGDCLENTIAGVAIIKGGFTTVDRIGVAVLCGIAVGIYRDVFAAGPAGEIADGVIEAPSIVCGQQRDAGQRVEGAGGDGAAAVHHNATQLVHGGVAGLVVRDGDDLAGVDVRAGAGIHRLAWRGGSGHASAVFHLRRVGPEGGRVAGEAAAGADQGRGEADRCERLIISAVDETERALPTLLSEHPFGPDLVCLPEIHRAVGGIAIMVARHHGQTTAGENIVHRVGDVLSAQAVEIASDQPGTARARPGAVVREVGNVIAQVGRDVAAIAGPDQRDVLPAGDDIGRAQMLPRSAEVAHAGNGPVARRAGRTVGRSVLARHNQPLV